MRFVHRVVGSGFSFHCIQFSDQHPMISILVIVPLARNSRGTGVPQTGTDGNSLCYTAAWWVWLASSPYPAEALNPDIHLPVLPTGRRENVYNIGHSLATYPSMQHVLSTYLVPGTVIDISDVMETWWEVLLIYLFTSILNKRIVHDTVFCPMATLEHLSPTSCCANYTPVSSLLSFPFS